MTRRRAFCAAAGVPIAGLGLLVLVTFAAPAPAQVIEPVGETFKLSSSPHPSDASPIVDARPGRGAVVVWTTLASEGTDDDGRSVQARLFDAEGAPLASDFQVNTTTAGDQDVARVAMAADGSFAVVWEDGRNMQARAFAPDASPTGDDFVIAEAADGAYFGSDSVVAALSEGDFVVSWQETEGYIFVEESVLARRFSPDDTLPELAFRIDTGSSYRYRSNTGIAITPDDHVLVTWDEDDLTFDQPVARPLQPSGAPAGPIVRIAEPLQQGWSPASTADESGNVLVVWENWRNLPGRARVLSAVARRLDRGGAPLGASFLVSPDSTASQDYLQLCSTSPSGFLVVWRSAQTHSTNARLVDAGGVSLGTDTKLDDVAKMRVPSRCGPRTVVAYDDGTMRGRIFRVDAHIFDDDFESGDLHAWAEIFEPG